MGPAGAASDAAGTATVVQAASNGNTNATKVCTGQQPAPSKSLHVLSPLSVRDRRLKRVVRSRKYTAPEDDYSSFRKQAA